MDRLLIERQSKTKLKKAVANLLESSTKDLRNYYSNDVIAVIDKMDFETPYIPDRVFNSDMFSEKDINDFLDYIYMDLLIQYGDLYTLRNYLERIRAMFLATIIPQMIVAGETSSKVRGLKKLQNSKYAFTDIISESFNKNVNEYQYSEKLDINPGAGIIRLPGMERDYSSPEYMNVRLDIISGGCKLIDSSDEINVYNNDPLGPYYINAIATGAPININQGVLEFADHQGIICDLVISFPDIIPVSRISFTQFSDAPFEIIQIQSSTMANQNIHYSGFDVIDIHGISYDNNEIEINFNKVNTREIHVFILQNQYKSTREAITIAKYKKITDYMDYCSKAIRAIDNKGFAENVDITLQLTELFKSIKQNTTFPVESITENIRSYTIGLYNLKVSSIIYYPAGYYKSGNYRVNGNISNISVTYDGIPVIKDNNSIIASSLFSVETADNTLYFGVPDDDISKVNDVAILEANTLYIDGQLTMDNEFPIRFSTHFLPKRISKTGPMNSFTIYFDDEVISLVSGDYSVNYKINQDVYSATILLSASVVKRHNLNDGITVSLVYTHATEDCYGNTYSISEIDILSRIGHPNIVNHRILPVNDSYLYVRQEISGEIYDIGYSENEYGKVALSGELYYSIGTGKGEILGSAGIVAVTKDITTNIYAHNAICTIPIDNMYASIFDEPMPLNKVTDTATINGQQYLKYKIDHPYIKNTLKIYDGLIPNNGIIEYENDFSYNVVPTHALSGVTDKTTVWILSGDIPSNRRAYYLPISKDYSGFDVLTNIASHNVTETYTSIPLTGIKPGRYPYLDMDIVNSDGFVVKNGIFTYQPMFSIVYEPIIVHVNGTKAKNITRYRSTDPEIDKMLGGISREDEYMYYLSNDGMIIPSKPMTGNITVQYYSVSDSLRAGIQMTKSNLYRDDLTPELYDFTILANVKR